MSGLTTLRDRTMAFLRRRQTAYRAVFTPDNVYTEEVLRDLAKFCRAHESTFHAEHTVSDRLDGRREVWLRLQQHLRLSDEELWKLFHGKD